METVATIVCFSWLISETGLWYWLLPMAGFVILFLGFGGES